MRGDKVPRQGSSSFLKFFFNHLHLSLPFLLLSHLLNPHLHELLLLLQINFYFEFHISVLLNPLRHLGDFGHSQVLLVRRVLVVGREEVDQWNFLTFYSWGLVFLVNIIGIKLDSFYIHLLEPLTEFINLPGYHPLRFIFDGRCVNEDKSVLLLLVDRLRESVPSQKLHIAENILNLCVNNRPKP